MREIKFRAWNGREFITDYYNHNHFISIKDGKLIQVEHDDVCAEGVVYGKPESVVLQQYTGLKDANGVEIYEGDIVAEKWTKKDLYDSGKFLYGVIKFIGGCFVEAYKNSERQEDVYKIDGESRVIVGNIYQNPELLK